MHKKHFLAVVCICFCLLFFAACGNTNNADDKPAFNNNFASTNPINKMVDQEITLDNSSTSMKIVRPAQPLLPVNA